MADELDEMVAEALAEQEPPALSEVEAAFQARYPTTAETPPATEPVEEPEPEEEGEDTGPSEPVEPPAADLIELAPGQSYPREDLARAAAFHAWLNAPENVAYARGLVEYLQSIQSRPPEAQVEVQPPTPPPGLDLEDPTVKALYDEILATRQAVAETQRQSMLAQQAEAQRQQQEINAIAQRARSSFMADNSLSADDMARLDAFLSRSQIGPAIWASFQRGIHPVTGQPVQPSFMDAALATYDLALSADPALSAKRLKVVAEKEKAARAKKGKLGALAGSSGSRPRSAPLPSTPQDLQKAFLDEVRSIMQGTSQE